MSIGLGLGLQGTPDMHLGMVKSRQAAKDRYDAAQQKKKGEMVDRFNRDFTKSMEGKRYLPLDERTVTESAAQWNDLVRSQVESGNPDMNAIAEMTYQVKSKAEKANAQREMLDKLMANPKQYGVFEQDLNIILSESDPNKVAQRLQEEGSGAIQYNPETREVIYDLIPKYSPVSDQMQQFVKDNGKYIFVATEMPSEAYGLKGTSVRNIEINPAAKNLFVENATSGENLRSTLRDYAADPSNRGKARPDPSTEEGMLELQNYAGRSFDIAAESLLKQEKFRQGGGITIKNNIYMPGEQKGVSLVSTTPQENNIYGKVAKEMGVNLSATSQGSIMFPEQEFTTVVPTNTINSDTRERISSTQGVVRGAKMSIYPTANKTVVVQVPDSNGELKRVTINKGEVVPYQLMPYYAKTAGIVYRKVIEASFQPTGQKGFVPIKFPATSDFENMAFQDMSKDKADAFDETVRRINDLAANINKLAPEIQAQLYNEYTGNLVENYEEIETKYIAPNKPTEKPTGSKTPTYGNQAPSKGGMLTNAQWKEMRKKKGQSTDFNSWNEYKNSFKK